MNTDIKHQTPSVSSISAKKMHIVHVLKMEINETNNTLIKTTGKVLKTVFVRKFEFIFIHQI